MFKTDWICILTSGNTVDGREVSAETLVEVAETYNPKTYNARINIEHNEYGSKLGSVLELKTEKHGDKVKLYAILKPNDYLLYLVQSNQKVHTSCEITPDFAGTGKEYLTGLAVTDSPASLGTTEMHLNNKNNQTPQVYCTKEPLPTSKNNLLNIFKKEDNQMAEKATLELIAQVKEEQSKLSTQLSAISELLQKLTAEDAPPQKEKTPEESDKYKALEEQVMTLSQELADLKTLLATQNDEQTRQQATGANTAEEIV